MFQSSLAPKAARWVPLILTTIPCSWDAQVGMFLVSRGAPAQASPASYSRPRAHLPSWRAPATMGPLTASIPLLWFLLPHQVQLSLLNWTLYDVTQSYLAGEVERGHWWPPVLPPQPLSLPMTSWPEDSWPHLQTEFLPCVIMPEKRVGFLASTCSHGSVSCCSAHQAPS